MATFTTFHEFLKYSMDGTIDLNSHAFLMYLTNAAPNAANHTVKADLAEIAPTGGYTSKALTVTWTETTTPGIWRFANNNDVSWTASGGTIGPFVAVVIYDSGSVSVTNALVGYWDVGSSISITSGNTFTVDLDTNFALFTLQQV